MRKLFISFITAILLTSCSADSLMKETELDLTDTEKVYSDITLTRKVAYDLYARMRMGRDRQGSFGFLGNIGKSPCMLVRICRLDMWNHLNRHRIKATLCPSQNSLLIF